MSVGLQRRVPALDDAAVPPAWKTASSEPPFPSFAPPAGSPAGPAFAASPAPSTPGPGFTGPPYAAPGPFGSPSARPGSGGGFAPGPPPQQHFPGPGFAPPGSPFHPHAPHPPMPPHPHMMAPLPPPVDRRHTPYFGQPDYRVYELNKRLQQRTEDSDNLWWDAFATEFFEDDATLTLTFCLEDGPKRYTIGRTLIPRYFRSIYEGGVSELYYTMRQPKESFHNTSITLDCDHCTMVTHHGKPMFTKVCTEGRLILEFTFDDLMRIKSWHMAVRAHRELIPRQAVHPPEHAPLDQLAKNITRQGITNSTLNYLRLCVILEPMQELMSRHKAYALSPRDCLKTTLFQKWQRMVAPPEASHPSDVPVASLSGARVPVGAVESQRPASKRRKRKGSAGANAAPPAPAKKRSPGPNFSLASQDVMVVGEPSLMGGEFGDEDERLITRLENTQYEGDAVEWSAPPPPSPAKTPPANH